MVGAGNVHSLLWTFLRLRNTCKQASMNIYSDSYGDLAVTVRMTFAGQADQAPRRGGRQSSRQERGPGTQAPSPVAPPPPPPAPTSPASAPARRARRRGPGALLREERRRQLRTAADVLTAERVGDPAPPHVLPPLATALILASRERAGALALPAPALPAPDLPLAPREREGGGHRRKRPLDGAVVF